MSTDKKYPSRYSNGKFVSSAQYITELICENKAKKDKLDLHFKFWINKEWSSYYRNQIGTANKLLKTYDAKAIIKALGDPKAKNIYSLRAPHLLDIIQRYQDLVEKESIVSDIIINRSEKSTFRKDSIKKNIISKLKELDNES
jgi:hypothetical protein